MGGSEGCVRRPADHRLRGGEEDREVCHSPAHDAQVEAQARTEGGHEGDVREGGEGGGETRLEGGEGFPRESTRFEPPEAAGFRWADKVVVLPRPRFQQCTWSA